jgi:hypothetical protein
VRGAVVGEAPREGEVVGLNPRNREAREKYRDLRLRRVRRAGTGW